MDIDHSVLKMVQYIETVEDNLLIDDINRYFAPKIVCEKKLYNGFKTLVSITAIDTLQRYLFPIPLNSQRVLLT